MLDVVTVTPGVQRLLNTLQRKAEKTAERNRLSTQCTKISRQSAVKAKTLKKLACKFNFNIFLQNRIVWERDGGRGGREWRGAIASYSRISYGVFPGALLPFHTAISQSESTWYSSSWALMAYTKVRSILRLLCFRHLFNIKAQAQSKSSE